MVWAFKTGLLLLTGKGMKESLSSLFSSCGFSGFSGYSGNFGYFGYSGYSVDFGYSGALW